MEKPDWINPEDKIKRENRFGEKVDTKWETEWGDRIASGIYKKEGSGNIPLEKNLKLQVERWFFSADPNWAEQENAKPDYEIYVQRKLRKEAGTHMPVLLPVAEEAIELRGKNEKYLSSSHRSQVAKRLLEAIEKKPTPDVRNLVSFAHEVLEIEKRYYEGIEELEEKFYKAWMKNEAE